MKTLFSVGFQSNNPFSVRHPSLTHLGAPMAMRQAPTMGDDLNAAARTQLQSVIAKGNAKLAQVRAWINTQYAKDPTLLATFKEQFIVNNWRGYDDIVTGDQYYADLAAQKIASSDPINWDFTDETLSRVEEWNKVIDLMSAGMQEYGGRPLVTTQGPMGPGGSVTNPRTGAPVQTSIAPGAKLSTPPPTSSGLSTNTLLIGGGIVAAALAVILAMKA